jgi:hypothetical protein
MVSTSLRFLVYIESTCFVSPYVTCVNIQSARWLSNTQKAKALTLTSICLLSHHPFFDLFRDILYMMRRIIDACNDSTSPRRVGASRQSSRWASPSRQNDTTQWLVPPFLQMGSLRRILCGWLRGILLLFLFYFFPRLCLPGYTTVWQYYIWS